jgi:hypothetical protein
MILGRYSWLWLARERRRRAEGGNVWHVEELALDEARNNLREAVALVVEANRMFTLEDAPEADLIREPFKVTA